MIYYYDENKKINAIIIYDLENKPEGILIIKNPVLNSNIIASIINFIEKNRMNYYWNIKEENEVIASIREDIHFDKKIVANNQNDFRNLIRDAFSIIIPDVSVEWIFISADEISYAFVN